MPKAVTIKAIILSRQNADGRHTIYIRITKNSDQRYISTEISVQKVYFNQKASLDKPEWISKKHPLATMYNDLIRKKLIELEPLRHEKGITSLQIKEKVAGIQETQTFNDFWLEFAKEQGKLVSIHSETKHKSEANKLTEFNPAVKFLQINYDLLKKYEAFLLLRNNRNTANKSLSFFNQAIKEAIKRKKIARDQNPFEDFKIKKVEVVSKAKEGVLEISDIKALQNYPLLSGTNRFHSRNIFLSQIHCAGARIGEMLKLKTLDIKENIVFYNMQKKGATVKKKGITISPALRKIIDIYFDPSKIYLFPYLENAHQDVKGLHQAVKNATTIVNEHLLEVCKLAGIEQHVSSHTARHTVAHMLDNAGVDIKAIQNTLGHQSESETKGYMENGKPLMVDETAMIIYNQLA